MKALLLIPRAAHDRLLSACDNAAPEYQLLANGVVESDAHGLQQIKILCDSDSAQRVLDFVRQTSPDIFAAIKQIENLDELSSK